MFEPETENSQVYVEVYQEYKNLVDLLLGCYMEDMGITPEQFERACMMNKNTRISWQFQQVRHFLLNWRLTKYFFQKLRTEI